MVCVCAEYTLAKCTLVSKPGRGPDNKATFIAAVELDDNGHPHPWRVRFDAITGTYLHVEFDKYRHRYLADAKYLVSRRFDLTSLNERLAYSCVHITPRPERWTERSPRSAEESS